MNNWNSWKTDEIFIWSSHIPRITEGERVTAWQDAVLRAGERHDILRIVANDWGYHRVRDGSIFDWIAAHGDVIESYGTFPTGFLLGRFASYTPASRIAFATADGRTEGWFTDVAELAQAAGLPPHGWIHPPIAIEPSYWDHDDSFTVSISTATDIWFPHNYKGHRTGPQPIDNRIVSAWNAPRLNAFLTEVHTACQALGGTWEWTRTPPGFYEVDHQGLVQIY
ncbi:hypothetical protein L3i22_074050 [Actinoplanes sp. L3-i22]|nr:hypothetical protein L3i22_074050 [Actinoplanes sp. L3-i22]